MPTAIEVARRETIQKGYPKNEESVAVFSRGIIAKDGTELVNVGTDGSLQIKSVVELHAGSGTPEAAVTAPIGSIFLRTDGSTPRTRLA